MEVNVNTIEEARRLVALRKYLEAFYTYVKVLNERPWVRTNILCEFHVLLTKLIHKLFKSPSEFHHMMHCVMLALSIYPHNVYLLIGIGDVFLRNKSYFQSLSFYKKAKSMDSSVIHVDNRIFIAKRYIFDLRFYRLYNDTLRNMAYITAIYSEIKPYYDRVLDLDGGIGLSALFAHLCMAPSTLSFNSSQGLMRLIQKIVVERRYSTILLMDKPIKDFVLPPHYGERDLIIINNFDEALFTEGMLDNLKYAWEHLACQYPRVLPYRAEYFVAGGNCNRISNKYELSKAVRNSLKIPHAMVFCELPRDKTFYCEDLEKYTDFKIVTHGTFLFSINFDNYDEVVAMNERSYHEANFVVKEDSEINVIVGWFKIYLTRNIIITNDPTICGISKTYENRVRGWSHAVFPNFASREVKMYQRIQARFMLNKGKLSFLPPPCKKALKISLPILRFLNDTEFLKKISNSISAATIQLHQIVDISEADLIDYSPFPMFGLQMMLRGARSLVCFAENKEDKAFIETVFKSNNIPKDKFTVLLGQCWNTEFYKNKIYHTIFCPGLRLRGNLDFNMRHIVQHLRLNHLVKGGLFLPSIKVIILLASSEYLDQNYKLFDKADGIKIASYMNEYNTNEAYNLDLTMLEYTPLSAPILLTDSYNLLRSTYVSVPSLMDGECNAILCWHQVGIFTNEREITTSRTGSFMNSFAYLLNPPIHVCKGERIKVLRIVDSIGLEKVVIDKEG